MRKNYFHLISFKERWGLTLWGHLLIVLVIFLFFIIGACNIYNLLAPVEREKADVLVLEGFISDYLLQDAINEFQTNKYKLLITTGTPLIYGELLAPYKNTANVAGMSLLKLGFDSTKLVMVGSNEIRNDRTYNSAVALREWLKKNRPQTKSLNLMTMGVHGARSQLLFQEAMGDTIKVG